VQDVKVVTVAPAVAAEGLRAIEAALSAVRMGAQPGLDPNANNAVAGSRCAYSSPGGGEDAFALARVESDANNRAVFRITVAGSDRGTVEGVRAALFSQIL
jgi:AP-2 complex subunit alpha